jgi:DNA-binding NarL/FixJ family response regulator
LTPTIRILLADDHWFVRAGVRAVLEDINEVQVVAEATDGKEALRLISELRPDLVLLDVAMPVMDGFAVLQRTVQQFPDVRVIILSVNETEEYANHALRSGARGYLSKTAAHTELDEAIKIVMRGDVYVSPHIAKKIFLDRLGESTATRPSLEVLTPRQREVLRMIAEGHSSKDIALTLNISVKTVETHRSQLMDRLNIHDIAGLVRYSIRMGLVNIDDD